ncbi:MAG TPA: FAD-dependent oxidoreductase [Terriglobales bacterium]|nr:FAD-dependent oxidoreductase [Terriglobales bacterium]
MERQLYTARLAASRHLSERTSHLTFQVVEVPRFDFQAGQFISMKALHEGRELTRAYSIASGPRGDNRFDLCLNRVDTGFFSNFLCDLESGSEVKFHGPHGYFVMKQPVRSSIFVATGTGIAPIRAMIEWLFASAERHAGHEFWLIFGNRTEQDIYYADQFQTLAREHQNFHFIPTLSRAGEGWSGARGYVQEHVRALAAGRSDLDAYICGLKEMVILNRDLLIKELGWERRSVLYERFD